MSLINAHLFLFFQCVRRLYNLYPNNNGWGYGTVKKDDYFQTSSFAEDLDVSKLRKLSRSPPEHLAHTTDRGNPFEWAGTLERLKEAHCPAYVA